MKGNNFPGKRPFPRKLIIEGYRNLKHDWKKLHFDYYTSGLKVNPKKGSASVYLIPQVNRITFVSDRKSVLVGRRQVKFCDCYIKEILPSVNILSLPFMFKTRRGIYFWTRPIESEYRVRLISLRLPMGI